MNKIDKVLKVSADIQLGIAMVALAAVIAINAVEIGSRFTMGVSMVWVQDASLLLMVWMIFPGVTKIVHDKKDIVITLLTEKLPPKVNNILSIFNYILISIFFILLTKYCYQLLVSQIGQTTATVRIPLVYYTSAVLLNCFSVTVIYVYEIFKSILAMSKKGGIA